MNLFAGLLIGFGNDTWLARIVICFIWGLIFCIYQFIVGDYKKNGGRGTIIQYVLVEYGTAVSTSLVFSIIAGVVKTIFIK